MKLKYLLTILIASLIIIPFSHSEEGCFKSAPEPHYNGTYGYLTDVTCDQDGEEYINSIQKVFQIENIRAIFIDKGKDGTCDYVWYWQGDDDDMWIPLNINTCADAEKVINDIIERRKELE